MQPIHYIIIFAVLIIIFLAVIRANRKDFKLEINKLVEYLGGRDNIIETEVEMSRFKVTLKDVTKANKEGIMKLGAKGVVEIEDQLKIIFGKDAKKLKKYMDDLKQKYDTSIFFRHFLSFRHIVTKQLFYLLYDCFVKRGII